jgi:hypothetical protein
MIRLAPLTAGLVLIFAAPSNAAPTVACPVKSGVVSRGAPQMLLYGQEHPDGGRMVGRTVRFFHFYETQKRRAALPGGQAPARQRLAKPGSCEAR